MWTSGNAVVRERTASCSTVRSRIFIPHTCLHTRRQSQSHQTNLVLDAGILLTPTAYNFDADRLGCCDVAQPAFRGYAHQLPEPSTNPRAPPSRHAIAHHRETGRIYTRTWAALGTHAVSSTGGSHVGS